MNQGKQWAVLLRPIGVICAIIVLVSGVTFAALQSQSATLQGSRITSATANLLIGDGSGAYSATAQGFNFDNIEPGGAPMPNPGNILSLKNSGTSNLALKLAMDINTFANPQNANTDRIYITLKPLSGTGPMQQFSLASLMTAYTTNTPVALNLTASAGQVSQYSLQVQMTADSVTSTLSGVALTGINLIFTGSSVVS
jgi:hypothetical protein